MTLKLCIQHRTLKYYQIYSNYDTGLTVTIFMTWSNLPYAFGWVKAYTAYSHVFPSFFFLIQHILCTQGSDTGPLVIYTMGRIRVCKIRFVSTGKIHGKPCLVCKKTKCAVKPCYLAARNKRGVIHYNIYTHQQFLFWTDVVHTQMNDTRTLDVTLKRRYAA